MQSHAPRKDVPPKQVCIIRKNAVTNLALQPGQRQEWPAGFYVHRQAATWMQGGMWQVRACKCQSGGPSAVAGHGWQCVRAFCFKIMAQWTHTDKGCGGVSAAVLCVCLARCSPHPGVGWVG